MKGITPSLVAVLFGAASVNGGGFAVDSQDGARDVLADIKLNAVENPQVLVGTEGDWTTQLKCNVDFDSQQPTPLNEQDCGEAKDMDGNACLWCDATQTIGSGLCVSEQQKEMIGQYWGQLCSGNIGTPDDTSPVAPPEPQPVPDNNTDNNDSNNNQIPDSLKCSMDASSNLIADKATCVAMKDATSASGENCVWCEVPVLGGSCITNTMSSSVSFLCQQDTISTEEGNYLRGDTNDNGGGGGDILDPSCLGDDASGLSGDKDTCVARKDSNGEPCIWCEAGNNVFGICATPSQTDFIGSYLDCDADSNAAVESPAVAVE